MIIIPRGKPVKTDLNSYYLDIAKLIEHFQGELGTGAIYLKSPFAEGLIFFDEDTIINVFYQDKNLRLDGEPARDHFINILLKHNFTVNVYGIEPDKIHFWANLSFAENLYNDLSTSTTALDELIRKMNNENLTGYVEVSIPEEKDSHLIIFNKGSIVGTSCPWDGNEPGDSKQNIQRLILKSRDSGAIFIVKSVNLAHRKSTDGSDGQAQPGSLRAYKMIQELLEAMELLVRNEKRIRIDFDTVLKKKFFEKADTYEFLDPFAAEFRYAGGTVEFSGNASPEELIRGVSESVKELAEDLGLTSLLLQQLKPWGIKYRDEINKFHIELR